MNQLIAIFLTAAGLLSLDGYAAVSGPYAADAYTLHLYHFDGGTEDDGVGPAIDLTPDYGASVTAGSYPGFGTALNTYEGSADTNANHPTAFSDERYIGWFTGADGAFTFEALVCPAVEIGAIPNNMQILSGDDDYGQTRGWQFRVTTSGQLEFIKLTGSQENFAVPLPASGDHGWAAGRWFHAAVTYNGQEGTADNLKFYWTALDSGASEAVLLGSFAMQADLSGWTAIDFAVGNDARELAGENFEGLIDEARISSTARAADAMLFVPGSPRAVILSQPFDISVQEPETAEFAAVFESRTTPAVTWFRAQASGDAEVSGTDPDVSQSITALGDGQYRAVLRVANTVTPDSGNYFCRIGNESGLPRDSEPAGLLVYGLVSHWTFDAVDLADGRFLDTVSGREASPSGSPVLVGGVDGEALQVSAGGGWADVSAFDPTLGSGQLTISLWVNRQESTGERDLQVAAFPGHDAVTVDGGLRADGQWQHLCLVYDGAACRMYVDGILAADGPWTLPEDTSAMLTIGAAPGGAEAFQGLVDDLRIYNIALTDTQAADLFYAVTQTPVCIRSYGAAYDLTGPAGPPDCVVDLYDLSALAGEWLVSRDLEDFAGFSGSWLSSGKYPE